jgi:hypothetical protein
LRLLLPLLLAARQLRRALKLIQGQREVCEAVIVAWALPQLWGACKSQARQRGSEEGAQHQGMLLRTPTMLRSRPRQHCAAQRQPALAGPPPPLTTSQLQLTLRRPAPQLGSNHGGHCHVCKQLGCAIGASSDAASLKPGLASQLHLLLSSRLLLLPLLCLLIQPLLLRCLLRAQQLRGAAAAQQAQRGGVVAVGVAHADSSARRLGGAPQLPSRWRRSFASCRRILHLLVSLLLLLCLPAWRSLLLLPPLQLGRHGGRHYHRRALTEHAHLALEVSQGPHLLLSLKAVVNQQLLGDVPAPQDCRSSSSIGQACRAGGQVKRTVNGKQAWAAMLATAAARGSMAQ